MMLNVCVTTSVSGPTIFIFVDFTVSVWVIMIFYTHSIHLEVEGSIRHPT